MRAILKKELKNYFLSPIGYVVIGIFLLCFRSAILLYSIIWINNNSTNINDENVCRRKKNWN